MSVKQCVAFFAASMHYPFTAVYANPAFTSRYPLSDRAPTAGAAGKGLMLRADVSGAKCRPCDPRQRPREAPVPLAREIRCWPQAVQLLESPATSSAEHCRSHIRFSQEKLLVATQAERDEILKLFAGRRVTDVCDGMDAVGLQDVGLMGLALGEERTEPYKPACMHYLHIGWVGVVGNIRWLDIPDFLLGIFCLDPLQDDGPDGGWWFWCEKAAPRKKEGTS